MNTKQLVRYLCVSVGTLTFHQDSLRRSHLTHQSSVLRLVKWDNDFRHVYHLGTWKEVMKSPGSGYDLKTQLQMKNTHSIYMTVAVDTKLALPLRAEPGGQKAICFLVCSVTRTHGLVALQRPRHTF